MSDNRLTYRSLSRRIRPARVATRVPAHQDGWEHAVLRMIENYSITWGGAATFLYQRTSSGSLTTLSGHSSSSSTPTAGAGTCRHGADIRWQTQLASNFGFKPRPSKG